MFCNNLVCFAKILISLFQINFNSLKVGFGWPLLRSFKVSTKMSLQKLKFLKFKWMKFAPFWKNIFLEKLFKYRSNGDAAFRRQNCIFNISLFRKNYKKNFWFLSENFLSFTFWFFIRSLQFFLKLNSYNQLGIFFTISLKN